MANCLRFYFIFLWQNFPSQVHAACLMCGRLGVYIPDRPNLEQYWKQFVTASTSTQVLVFS